MVWCFPMATSRLLPLVLLPILSSCAPPWVSSIQERPPQQLESIHLQHRDENGQLSWSLRSPKAHHDWARKASVVMAPEGLVYQDGLPIYRFSAQRALLLGNSRLVQLDGLVQLEHLQKPATVITGERLRWHTHEGHLTMPTNPVLTYQEMRITAGWAELDFASNHLSLHDQVVAMDQSPQAGDLHLEATALRWNMAMGDFTAPGLVKGQQNAPDGQLQSVEGYDLTGNSQEGWLQLQAPVQLQTKAAGQWQARGPVLWWPDRQQLDSAGPLNGQVGALRVFGDSAALDLNKGWLTIANNCHLHQPGETLKAQQCRWNLHQGAVVAQGDVQLKREQYQQFTRADQLEGQLGESNVLRFLAPSDSQVSTELELETMIMGSRE